MLRHVRDVILCPFWIPVMTSYSNSGQLVHCAVCWLGSSWCTGHGNASKRAMSKDGPKKVDHSPQIQQVASSWPWPGFVLGLGWNWLRPQAHGRCMSLANGQLIFEHFAVL